MTRRPPFRPALDGLLPYRPGNIASSLDGTSCLLASNESPYGPLPTVLEAIREAAQHVNRYPDSACQALTRDIAARHGLCDEQVVLGCGSLGVIQMLLESVGEPGVEIVYAWRSFEAYPRLIRLSGAKPVPIPLRDEAHDLPGILEAVTERTRLIFVCNPNNPTGTVVRRVELEAFLNRVPAGCLVVLDEAYREYVRDDEVVDGLALLPQRENVVVLRTFSKAYGLAGLRVGYMAAHAAVARQVRKARLAFSVSHVAQIAAAASLRAEDELLGRVEVTIRERNRVREQLLAQGWTVPVTEANFVWLRLPEQASDFALACAEAGVNVRAFDGEGVRVSIGDPVANDAFLTAAARFRRHGPGHHGGRTQTILLDRLDTPRAHSS